MKRVWFGVELTSLWYKVQALQHQRREQQLLGLTYQSSPQSKNATSSWQSLPRLHEKVLLPPLVPSTSSVTVFEAILGFAGSSGVSREHIIVNNSASIYGNIEQGLISGGQGRCKS